MTRDMITEYAARVADGTLRADAAQEAALPEPERPVLDALQNVYDDLQDELEVMLEQTDDALMMNAAGMAVQLKDGSMCTLRVSPDVVTRILTVLEFDELQSFVENIAKSVEDPDDGHFCHNT